MVASQVKRHMDLHGLMSKYQSAYRKKHSTETALLCIKSDIHMSLARGKPTALMLLDLSAAFDTVDHTILLDRLSTWFGLSGSVLKWFESYLTGRSQAVKIGSAFSDPANLRCGVPQGPVLGSI